MRSLVLAALWCGVMSHAAAAQSHLVIVAGLGGDAEHRERFYQFGRSLADAARDRWGLPADNIVYLSEKPERDPERISARSTKENVERVLGEVADRAGPMAQVTIVLIGHGSSRGEESRFNLPGPDMNAQDFARLLERFPTQQIAFVNTTSASGGFIPVLSGERRTVVTATKSGYERSEPVFVRYFIDAFASDVADVDKDERVSMFEAFAYAKREVEREYEQEGQLLTEHALLDDNGDGEGSDEPGATADGALARAFFFGGAVPGPAVATSDDPELERLYRAKADLERLIAELRAKKSSMDPEAYDAELERLLLDLARNGQAIRQREGKR